jgi:hypothetical protein
LNALLIYTDREDIFDRMVMADLLTDRAAGMDRFNLGILALLATNSPKLPIRLAQSFLIFASATRNTAIRGLNARIKKVSLSLLSIGMESPSRIRSKSPSWK